MADIKLYSDGACSGNPGPGGYGTILSTILNNGQLYEVKYSQGFRLTTNNRMELAGVIAGLTQLRSCNNNVEVISDSKYVCDAFNKHWIDGWIKNNFNGRANKDLWIRLVDLVKKQNSVKFIWVKGHADNPYNNECDRLAVCATKETENHSIDNGYEKKVDNFIIGEVPSTDELNNLVTLMKPSAMSIHADPKKIEEEVIKMRGSLKVFIDQGERE